jgi:RNA polymerase sigma factor (sigma-70 family)
VSPPRCGRAIRRSSHVRKAELVQLRHLAGLSIPEIAAIAGVSERTVKRDLQFARAFLRAVIEKAAVR